MSGGVWASKLQRARATDHAQKQVWAYRETLLTRTAHRTPHLRELRLVRHQALGGQLLEDVVQDEVHPGGEDSDTCRRGRKLREVGVAVSAV